MFVSICGIYRHKLISFQSVSSGGDLSRTTYLEKIIDLNTKTWLAYMVGSSAACLDDIMTLINTSHPC